MDSKRPVLNREKQELAPSPAAAISLAYLFHLVTGCALFFACYRQSPMLALSLTLIIAPTLIRTQVASEFHRKEGLEFNWRTRLTYFGTSMVVVMTTFLISGLAFLCVSMMFGIFAVLLGGLMGLNDLRVDSAVLGTAGGMVWGIAAAFLAICFTATRVWKPKIEVRSVGIGPKSV